MDAGIRMEVPLPTPLCEYVVLEVVEIEVVNEPVEFETVAGAVERVNVRAPDVRIDFRTFSLFTTHKRQVSVNAGNASHRARQAMASVKRDILAVMDSAAENVPIPKRSEILAALRYMDDELLNGDMQLKVKLFGKGFHGEEHALDLAAGGLSRWRKVIPYSAAESDPLWGSW